ncbi:MAG: DUF6328 family protein [Micrococcales bacterium]|nr:DUF6328 family protein [Micrococcales bacterium]
MSEPPSSSRDESPWERLDRNFNEQLQEVRVAQAGVRVLFGFLLILPFQARFESLSQFQLNVYLVTLLSSAIAVLLFTAPAAIHRVLFRRGVKDYIVSYTSKLTGFGLIALAISVVGGVTLVLDMLLSRGAAIAIGALIAGLAIVLWVLVPEWHKRTTNRHVEHDEQGASGPSDH